MDTTLKGSADMIPPLQPKAAVLVVSLGGWLFSLAAATHHSFGLPPGGSADGILQLGEHLPLIIVIFGGIAALWKGVSAIIALYAAALVKVQAIVKEEMSKQTEQFDTQLARIEGRVAEIGRIVDSRGRPAPPPFSVPRKGTVPVLPAKKKDEE
jgi:hypothetical protein